MTNSKTFTLVDTDGQRTESGLTLIECAREIIQHDGVEYELRPSTPGEGFDLWLRQQVANRPWRRTDMFSIKVDESAAEIDILMRFANDSRRHGRFSIMSDEAYAAMLKEIDK